MNSSEVIARQSIGEEKSNLARRHFIEKVAFGVLWLFGGAAVLALAGVTFFVLIQALAFFMGPELFAEDIDLYPSNAALREAVATSPYAIGYLSFGYLDDSTRALSLNGTAPTLENAEQGKYYIVRSLNMLTSGEPEGATRAWLTYMLGDAGQALIREAGYVPAAEAVVLSSSESVQRTETLAVVGSTTLQPLAEILAEPFMTANPSVLIDIQGGGSSVGVAAVGKGEADIGMGSVAVSDVDLERYADLHSFEVARDGIAIIVHPDNALEDLSIIQVRDIFSGKISNWKEVGGEDAAIVVVGREEGSGTETAFVDWVMGKGALLSKGLRSFNVRQTFQGVYGIVSATWGFLTTSPKGGLEARGGMSTTIVATFYLVLLTLFIATPMGVGAGVYLVEYAGEMTGTSGLKARFVALIRFGVETLAGVPSIIFGLFGYILFVTLMQFGFSMLAAALSGACLVLPVIIRTTEESLLTVPRSYREASLALGSTQWQTIWKVVLPAALPGIITGIVLSVGRIVSETAVFYVTLGGSYQMPPSPLLHPGEFLSSGGRTMALHLYYLANDTAAFDKAMGTGAILVLSIVLINLVINYFSRRLSQNLRGVK